MLISEMLWLFLMKMWFVGDGGSASFKCRYSYCYNYNYRYPCLSVGGKSSPIKIKSMALSTRQTSSVAAAVTTLDSFGLMQCMLCVVSLHGTTNQVRYVVDGFDIYRSRYSCTWMTYVRKSGGTFPRFLKNESW